MAATVASRITEARRLHEARPGFWAMVNEITERDAIDATTYVDETVRATGTAVVAVS
jgi:hypothetical protein